MGVVEIRAAFTAASDGSLRCMNVTHGYDHSEATNRQVVTFSGQRADGTPFEHTVSCEACDDVLAMAAQAALAVLAKKTEG